MYHDLCHENTLLQALPPDQNTKIEFKDETVGTNVPKQYVPGVEKGFRFMCEAGYHCGFKIAGVRFRLLDGMHHCVDSSEFSFYMAAQGAMRETFEHGLWKVIEPIMLVEINAPLEYQVNICISYTILMLTICSNV